MSKPVQSLVLDATPLITQSASTLQQYASKFFTTPGVKNELRDENARNQLLLWGDALVVRHPKQVYIDKVSAFARLTGDYSVLSMNDIHIIALAYELEFETNGEKGLRKYPGEKLEGTDEALEKQNEERARIWAARNAEKAKQAAENPVSEQPAEESKEEPEDDDGFVVVSRKSKRPNWKHKKRQQYGEKPQVTSEEVSQAVEAEETKTEEAQEAEGSKSSEDVEDVEGTEDAENAENAEEQEEDEEDLDDDGEWITPVNLQEVMTKDQNESVRETAIEEEQISVAISTGDFACQNVSMQVGLKLMNHLSGKQIKSVKNFMYRCHACFKISPMGKSGERKHFCPKCGGDTLLRCAVSVDNVTGKITPHLKSNFKFITRGQVYSMASPLSKKTQQKQGNGGYQHNRENRHKDLQEAVILREDQREYSDAMKEDAWRRRKNEKMLQEFVGGGSADNIISPFGNTHRSGGVRVGRGRHANAVRVKRK